jgi:RNA polymerase sigma-70 factor (ECF subfamily)
MLQSFRSDDALMKAFAKGSAEAFNELYRRHKDGLYRFLLRSSPTPQIAEDLTQEAWSSLIKRAASYQAQGTFKTWLFTIARHKLIDFTRSQTHKMQNATVDEHDIESSSLAQDGNPESTLRLEQLLERIKQLPAEQREAFVLQHEGFSLAEIAKITNSAQETVKSRIRYARTRLKADLSISPEVAS